MTHGIAFDSTLKMVVIGGGKAYISVTNWFDSDARRQEFIMLERTSLGTAPPARQWVETVVELVPRPDNSYNSNAISVAQPHTYGGTAEDRHIGYVPNADLPHLGGPRFLQVIEEARKFNGAPLGCRARVKGGASGRIDLCLPDARFLRILMDDFLHRPQLSPVASGSQMDSPKSARRKAPQSSADRLYVPPARIRQAAQLDAHAQQQLSKWQRRGRATIPPGPVKIQQRSVFGTRRVYVANQAGGRIGKIDEGTVFLSDEGYRPAALEAAANAGVELSGSPVLTDECPHAVVECEGDVWVLKVVSDVLPMGWYEPEANRLHIHASAYRQPALVLLARLGVFPDETVWDAPPPEVYLALVKPTKSTKTTGTFGDLGRGDFGRIWAHHKKLLPKALASHSPLFFTTQETRPALRSNTTDFLFTDYHGFLRYALEGLFGPYVLDEKLRGKRPVPCRLCGGDALPIQRTGEDGANWLAYCGICLRNAARGFFVDGGNDEPWEPLAVWALIEAAAEFGGAPSQAQVLRLPSTASPRAVDRGMLVRMHVPRIDAAMRRGGPQARAPYTWFDWLAKAGLVADGIQTARGVVSVAKDGHLCRSLLERHIDDFFTANKIAHEVEPHWPYDPELNPNGMRADWLLHDGTYVEAWGLPDKAAYAQKMQNKTMLAAKHGIRLLSVTSKDLGRLHEIFAPFLTPARR